MAASIDKDKYNTCSC